MNNAWQTGVDLAQGKDHSLEVVHFPNGQVVPITTVKALEQVIKNISHALGLAPKHISVTFHTAITYLRKAFPDAKVCKLCDGLLLLGANHKNFTDCVEQYPASMAKMFRTRRGRREMRRRLRNG